MKKDKRNILILVTIVVLVVIISYFIFKIGLTDRLKASVQSLSAVTNDEVNASDLPIINNVINSSGETLVNTDVALIIDASSNYNITNLEYSVDLKSWKKIKGDFNDKEVSAKLVFSKTMNETIYIRATNDHGYSSYAYATKVMIDKEEPSLKVTKSSSDIIIKASDNDELASVQFSTDKLNWTDEEVSGESITLRKQLNGEKYIRVVDKVGNISNIKEIDE